MSFLRTSFSVLAVQALVAPTALLSSVVLARGLPVYDRGLYAAASEFAAIVVTVIELGWATTTIYRLRSAQVPSARVVGSALWVSLLASAVAVAVCYACRDLIRSKVLSDADPILLYIALAAIPFEVAGLVFTGVARGLGDFALHNAHRLGTAVLLLAGVGIAVGVDGSAASALVALLVAHAITGMAVVLLIVRRAGIELAFPLAEVRQSLRFGVLSHAQQILLTLHQRLDLLLLAWLANDPEAVAVYAVAVGTVNRVRILPMSVALAMFPTIAGQSDEVASRFVAKVSRFSIALVLLTALGLGATAWFLVPLLFGREYAASVGPLLLLLPAAVFLTPAMLLSRYFTSRARQQVSISILLVSTALNVGLNLAWIPRFGVLGAAGASVISYGLQFALMLVAFARASGLRLSEAAIVDREDLRAYRARLRDGWRRGAT